MEWHDLLIAQEMTADYKEKILAFHKFVIKASNLFWTGQVGNMDKVPLTFDVWSNKTAECEMV